MNENTFDSVYVYDHKYCNTGGHTMVSFFKLWIPAENVTRFMAVNEEGCSISTAEWLSVVVDYPEDTVISTCSIDTLDRSNKYFNLYRHCWFEFIKKDSKEFGIIYSVPARLMDRLSNNDAALRRCIKIEPEETVKVKQRRCRHYPCDGPEGYCPYDYDSTSDSYFCKDHCGLGDDADY